jgi:hypothetical protein
MAYAKETYIKMAAQVRPIAPCPPRFVCVGFASVSVLSTTASSSPLRLNCTGFVSFVRKRSSNPPTPPQAELLEVYIETEAWDEAFTLSQLTPALGATVHLPYARWLASRDRFEEAQVGSRPRRPLESGASPRLVRPICTRRGRDVRPICTGGKGASSDLYGRGGAARRE